MSDSEVPEAGLAPNGLLLRQALGSAVIAGVRRDCPFTNLIDVHNPHL